MVLRFIYNRFGEILTLLVSVLIGIYLVNSFSGSAALIAAEERARERVKEIYRLQKKASAEGKKILLKEFSWMATQAYLPVYEKLSADPDLEDEALFALEGLNN